MNTCSEVGGLAGRARPSALSSASNSCRTVSSEEAVVDEERESAGVEVGEEERFTPRARASAWERAER